jgi:hypothetical protein
MRHFSAIRGVPSILPFLSVQMDEMGEGGGTIRFRLLWWDGTSIFTLFRYVVAIVVHGGL